LNWIGKKQGMKNIRYQIKMILKSKRACPPEDCGGPWGYQHLLKLLETPERKLDEDAKARLEWRGGEWNAEAFELEEVNDSLSGWKPNETSFMYAKMCR